MSRPKVLIADDERFVRESLTELLESAGFAVTAVEHADAAAKLLDEEELDVVLTDLRMPNGDGMSLLERARAAAPTLPVIVFTGAGSVADAVRAMKAGAFDFLLKPVDPDELTVVVRRACEHRELLAEVGQLRRAVHKLRGRRALVGSAAAMAPVFAAIEQVAATDATVLVTGESGTGKELVAQALHDASPRSDRALVEVNCAAIPAELFESELFGHRRGAFTGAVSDRRGRFGEAEGGTLLLDEVGTLPLALQAKLLRVLESGEYQPVGDSRTRLAAARIVALTNEDLGERVREGTFRADLFYRLNVFPIEVPPLRRRKEDIPAIAAHLLRGLRNAPDPLDEDALAVLAAYDWPGNVRELRNVLERATIVAGAGGRVDAALLGRILESTLHGSATGAGGLREQLDAHERHLLLQALAQARGHRRAAAEALGIDPRNLSYYLRKHGLAEPPRSS